ncbi:hypothetical protein [Streptomyces sp. NBC_01546]|uniref:hypothetical protein n=1 Tax=Streptomyces sp. NBC_01546 TaxID=2975872 RepID=UPI00386B8BE2
MRKAALAASVSFAILATAATAGTAQAESRGTISCSTTGAEGEVNWSHWASDYSSIDLGLHVIDTAADGHHVKVRFVSENLGHVRTYWPWRSFYDGSGAGQAWYTSAQNGRNGIYILGMQVARYEGNTMLNSRTCWRQ